MNCSKKCTDDCVNIITSGTLRAGEHLTDKLIVEDLKRKDDVDYFVAVTATDGNSYIVPLGEDDSIYVEACMAPIAGVMEVMLIGSGKENNSVYESRVFKIPIVPAIHINADTPPTPDLARTLALQAIEAAANPTNIYAEKVKTADANFTAQDCIDLLFKKEEVIIRKGFSQTIPTLTEPKKFRLLSARGEGILRSNNEVLPAFGMDAVTFFNETPTGIGEYLQLPEMYPFDYYDGRFVRFYSSEPVVIEDKGKWERTDRFVMQGANFGAVFVFRCSIGSLGLNRCATPYGRDDECTVWFSPYHTERSILSVNEFITSGHLDPKVCVEGGYIYLAIRQSSYMQLEGNNDDEKIKNYLKINSMNVIIYKKSSAYRVLDVGEKEFTFYPNLGFSSIGPQIPTLDFGYNLIPGWK